MSERGWSLLQNQCHGLLPVLPLEGQGARQHLKLQGTRVRSGSGPAPETPPPPPTRASHSAPRPGGPPGSRTVCVPPHSVNQTTRSRTRGLRLGRGPVPGRGHPRWGQARNPSKEGNCSSEECEASLAMRGQEKSLRDQQPPSPAPCPTDGETEAQCLGWMLDALPLRGHSPSAPHRTTSLHCGCGPGG